MNREYLNVILADSDEGNRTLFKRIFKDLRITVKVQNLCSGEDVMGYLNSEKAIIPEILFMNHDISEKDSLERLQEIRADYRFNSMVVVVYSTHLAEESVEEILVKGANIYIKKPDNYEALKKILSDVITINWQYHTSGLNKDSFIMKMS